MNDFIAVMLGVGYAIFWLFLIAALIAALVFFVKGFARAFRRCWWAAILGLAFLQPILLGWIIVEMLFLSDKEENEESDGTAGANDSD